ncbi:G-protein coupled receptor 84-like, partial [Morone saxatilis]|uniref:G-protein coupled receptor 84-like n=1 Tax=Morone saxatilis TaxID=34816 RepID=UPI0015E24243
ASFGPLWPLYVFVPNVCMCSIHRTRGRPYTTILLLFSFLISLCCIGVFYLLIYRRVLIASQALLHYRFSRRSSRKKPASSAQGTDDSDQNTDEISCENPSKSNQSSDKASHSSATKSPPDIVPTSPSPRPAPTNEAPSLPSTASGDKEMKRVTHMCLTVFLCVVICFVPFLLLNLADKHNRAPQLLHMFCANLTWLNSCINPVLYAVMNRQFRQAYHVLLTRAATPFSYLWAWWSTLRS